MTVAGIALLFHVLAIHGIIWEGVGSAWIIGMLVDALLVALGLACYFKPPK